MCSAPGRLFGWYTQGTDIVVVYVDVNVYLLEGKVGELKRKVG